MHLIPILPPPPQAQILAKDESACIVSQAVEFSVSMLEVVHVIHEVF